MDYSYDRPDDLAADAAIQQMTEAGWYTHQRQTTFDYGWYWDTVAEMQDYFAGRGTPILFNDNQITQYGQQLESGGPGARLRMVVPMSIGRYTKSV